MNNQNDSSSKVVHNQEALTSVGNIPFGTEVSYEYSYYNRKHKHHYQHSGTTEIKINKSRDSYPNIELLAPELDGHCTGFSIQHHQFDYDKVSEKLVITGFKNQQNHDKGTLTLMFK